MVGFAALIAAHLSWGGHLSTRPSAPRWPWLAGIVVALISLHLGTFVGHLNVRPIDIATETIRAAEVFFGRGANPYLDPVNSKYPPLNFILYAPLGLFFDTRGIFVTNAAWLALTVWALVDIGRRHSEDSMEAWFPAIVFLACPFLARSLFVDGVNDIAAVALATAAYAALLPGRWKTAGLLLGCSVLVKWPPGILFLSALCLVERKNWKVAAVASAVAAVGAAPFLLWNAPGFVSNVIAHGQTRSLDSTAFVSLLNPGMRRPVAFVLMGGVAGVVVWIVRSRSPERLRVAAGTVFLMIGALLLSKVNHRNYQLWYLPFAAVALGNFFRRDYSSTGCSSIGLLK